MLRTALGFCEDRVIVPFLRRRPQVFPLVGVIMNLNRFDVLLDDKFFGGIFFVFSLFFVEEKR